MQYAWLIWSLILIAIWALIYFFLKTRNERNRMLVVSLWTSLSGLTEPLFVPEYWSPPSLFNLNMLTGFDVESIIWAFGVGGIVVVLYEYIFRTKHRHLSYPEQHKYRHRFHYLTIGATPILLIALLFIGWNIIYASIAALMAGGVATRYCRPDLAKKMIVSSFLFLALYYFYFLILIALFPGYVERVWNLEVLSGVLITGIPLEELLFAIAFGFYWSSIYEHLAWRKIKNT